MLAQTIQVRPQRARLVVVALAAALAGAVALGVGSALDQEDPARGRIHQTVTSDVTGSSVAERPTLREIEARRSP